MSEKSLSEQAAEKRRQYRKSWNAKNRDKVREHTRRYWERKVLSEQEREAKINGADHADGSDT